MERAGGAAGRRPRRFRRPYALIAVAALACLGARAGTFTPVHARNAMVVTAEPHATAAGVEILRKGGNAVDAAVAVGFALAVTEPNAGNLGGGGFMLIRFADGRSTFLDFRERAPAAADRDMYLDEDGKATADSRVGYRAVAVPGTVRGFELALRKYGTKTWSSLVAPRRAPGAGGVSRNLGPGRVFTGKRSLGAVPRVPQNLPQKRRPIAFGEPLQQRDLAGVLQRLAENGADEFYRGRTRAAYRRRHGGQRRPDFARRPRRLSARGAQSPARRLQRVRDSRRAAAQLRRSGRHSNAEHARRLEPGRRGSRFGGGDSPASPKSCGDSSRTGRNTSATRISSRFRWKRCCRSNTPSAAPRPSDPSARRRAPLSAAALRRAARATKRRIIRSSMRKAMQSR